MEKKRSFFRGYLHGSKSTSKLPCHLEGRSDSTTDTNTILEKALEKANMAVSYDSMERPVDAVRAYKEAVDLLQGVLETASPDDQSRLQKISDSYTERIRLLEASTTEPRRTTHKDMLHTIAEEMTSPLRRRKASRPPSLINDSNIPHEISQPGTPVAPYDTMSTHTTDSSRTIGAGSVFASMFAKKAHTRPVKSSSTSTHDLSAAMSLDPKPSRSTPIASFGRSAITWRHNSSKKKRHSSEFTKVGRRSEDANDRLPPLPPSLPLPAVASSSKEDYFDIRSTGAADLLFAPPTCDLQTENRRKSTDSESISTTLSSDMDDTMQTSASHVIFSVARPYKTAEPLVFKPLKPASNADSDSAIADLAKVLEESSSGIGCTEKNVDAIQELSGLKSQNLPKKHAKKSSQGSIRSRYSDRERDLSPQLPSPQASSFSSFWRSSRRVAANEQKHAKENTSPPTLPPLKLQRSADMRTSRLRSSSNASDTSQSSLSSPSVSSPCSHQSSRTNDWSLFDVQSTRASSLFSASMLSLALPPKEKNCFATVLSGTYTILEPNQFHGAPEDHTRCSLMQRLSRCIQEGGYLTNRLYVPKELWRQPNIRLPALEAKIAVCELLISALEPMAARDDRGHVSGAIQEVRMLEHSLEQVRETFGRKLGLHEGAGTQDEVKSPTLASNYILTSSTSKTTQTIASWSSKFSKSVERMKMETLRTSEEQHYAYIHTLVQLFSLAQALDEWHAAYSARLNGMSQQVELYENLLSKIQTCADTLQKVVCGFVLQDFTILLNKWMKRSREWTMD